MEPLQSGSVAGASMEDYSLLYHLTAAGTALTVAADGRVFAGNYQIATLEPILREVSDMLTEKAQKVFDTIKSLGGGVIEEYVILRRADLSHGSFSAARKELIDTGRLALGKEGRKTVYILSDAGGADNMSADASEEPVNVKPDFNVGKAAGGATLIRDSGSTTPPPRRSASPRRKPKALADVCVSRMPNITGEFTDIDEWEDTIISQIDGDVDISPLSDTQYKVTAYELDESVICTVIDEGDCIRVS